ncbi:MAG TPA: peptide-binding protein [Candidatus Methylomirabilis sp.]|nr:peptide-binding protein [Candidatus Methylomirabilis sp.]
MAPARRLSRWLPAGLLILGLAGCGGEAPSAEAPGAVTGPPAYGDTIVEASIGDISGLIPNITSDSASHSVGSLIYDGLVRADRDLSLTGELAESWTISKDERTITFHLKKGVRWHDGAPFTARDVEFTYRYMRDPKTPTAYAEDFLQAASLEVVDPHTVRVHYERPYAPALLSWALWVLPAHILEEPWRKGVDLRTTPQNRHPIGTGPFRFHEWKTQEKVVVLANPDYHRGRPYLDRVVLRIIPDPATIFLELKARNVDMAGLTPLQFRRQTEYPAFAKFFEKYRYLSNSYAYLGFNLKDPRFADRLVRQAIAHAIDKQEIIEGVLLGLGQEAVGPYKPGTWWYTDQVRTFPYDPDRAKALLREAGWRDRDGDGILEKDGKPFRFTIRTNQGNSVRIQTAEIIQRRLKAVGIDVNIHVVEWAAFINTFIRKRDFEAIILGWGLGLDPDQYEIWHSSKTGPDQLNHVSYSNPEVDRLLEQGRRTFDRERRTAIYREFQRVLAEDQPLVFLYVPEALTAVSSRIRGIEPAPAGLAWNFIRWYVPQDAQRYTR